MKAGFIYVVIICLGLSVIVHQVDGVPIYLINKRDPVHGHQELHDHSKHLLSTLVEDHTPEEYISHSDQKSALDEVYNQLKSRSITDSNDQDEYEEHLNHYRVLEMYKSALEHEIFNEHLLKDSLKSKIEKIMQGIYNLVSTVTVPPTLASEPDFTFDISYNSPHTNPAIREAILHKLKNYVKSDLEPMLSKYRHG